MIDRIYVHNYRCFENFTLDLTDRGSVLVIGKNGSGYLFSALPVTAKLAQLSNARAATILAWTNRRVPAVGN